MSAREGGVPHLYEVLTSGSSHATLVRDTLLRMPAAELLCGAVAVEDRDGWARPWRFSEEQLRALQSCLAWHPGLYRQMARTTAGVCLRFATDATEVCLAVRVDEEPRATGRVLAPLDTGRRRTHDGFSVVVDGRACGCNMPSVVARSLPWIDEDESGEGLALLAFELEQRGGRGAPTMAIPGLGQRHEVCVWLPCLRGCEVRELWCDGTYVEPLPMRNRMLVLGDSIAQGFCGDDPMLTWPALLSEHFSLELVNQSVGGQVFQPSAVTGRPVDGVELVLVELGTNYWHEACAESQVARDARSFLREVQRLYGDARVLALTPIGHKRSLCPPHERSCAARVPVIIGSAARDLGIQVIEGTKLIGRDDPSLVDGEHPSDVGHVQLASRLAAVLQE